MEFKRQIVIWGALLCSLLAMAQQRFFNLTAEEVRVDSVLRAFACSYPLSGDFADSLYEVQVLYPEFMEMSRQDAEQVNRLSTDKLPSMPLIETKVVRDRKQGILSVSFLPFVCRNGKYQKLVSFMLDVKAKPRSEEGGTRRKVQSRAGGAAGYAAHSVLASGMWAKIRIPQSGVYQLTDALVRKAGFTNLSKVKVFGYGGAKQAERLDSEDLRATDDLQEVPTCIIGGRRLFHAQGTVSWKNKNSTERTRNPYSDYGYYFITQDDNSDPMIVDSAAFVATFYPGNDDYHALYEVDDFAWFEGGSNLFESKSINVGDGGRTITLSVPDGVSEGGLSVVLTSPVDGARATVTVNDSLVGNMILTPPEQHEREYEHGRLASEFYTLRNLKAENSVKITTTSGGPVRIDYISLYFNKARELPNLLTTNFETPEYVYNITNQDLHADEGYQMVIIIPASQKLRAQAERLKAFHEQHDGLRVRLLPADELYNEFSSGTPDANAYRRYLKMLYDRAQTADEMPRYLLLFGDCAWDNRMSTSEWKGYDTDDFLLCHESENSFSKTKCYVNDGFFCCLDDGEGDDPTTSDLLDMAVGRFPVRTADEAKIMVDKTISYAENQNVGDWQNTVVFMGDDGNENVHMEDALAAAALVENLHPGLYVKRVMWDAYNIVPTSTGNTYPDVSEMVKQQQNRGALLMDYVGHAGETSISHEKVLLLNDFSSFTNANLPLWVTAACDVMPYDGQSDNIGEAALLNPKGGALAFFGTTRTVYTRENKYLNIAFLTALFTPVEGKYISIGEAQRIAKNNVMVGYKYTSTDARGYTSTSTFRDLSENKLQYALLGDPALVLHIPTLTAVVDRINDQIPDSSEPVTLKAGSVVTFKGHVEQGNARLSDFNGTVNMLVRDAEESIQCFLNNTNSESGASKALVYNDRTKVLFNGQDSVRNGEFSVSFAVPKDISYSGGRGKVNVFVKQTGRMQTGSGSNTSFVVGGSALATNDSIGPSIFCYLNTPQFQNGDRVNTTPYFVAEIRDKDGLNTTGNGIGHNLELIIDGEMSRTYVLNDNFAYDFGSYTSGRTYYNIPELEPGMHRLQFKAWDILNNSSTAELTFNVTRALEPNCIDVNITQNPVRTTTTFLISHDRAGSELDVAIDIFDMSGRLLQTHEESGIASGNTYTVDWNVSSGSGFQLQTGVYLYRVRLSSGGSSSSSKAKKMIVIK